MRKIERIFIHCTAGNQKATDADLLKGFKNRGWQYPGYHYVVHHDGTVSQLLDVEKVSNGVQGYNSTSINIAYTGGIDAKGKGVDNRTDAQKQAILTLLHKLKATYPKAQILGHRDISPDKNKNGKVDPWERIKECPCFDAMVEYADI